MTDCLYEEFSGFYNENRCKWAPDNPRRVFGLARHLYERDYGDKMTASEFVAVAYQTLNKLFRWFKPEKYSGNKRAADHFAFLFAEAFKQDLRKFQVRTDRGRHGDPLKFRGPKPERISLQNQWAREKVQAAVEQLPDVERQVIVGRYWDDLDDCQLAKKLKLDRRTIKKKHDKAIERLRDEVA